MPRIKHLPMQWQSRRFVRLIDCHVTIHYLILNICHLQSCKRWLKLVENIDNGGGMLRKVCITLFGALSFALSACTTTKAPHVDAQLGQATRSLFAQQIEHPEASKNTTVPVGMAAEAMSGLNNYHQSFAVKSDGGSAPASGGNSSSGGGEANDSVPRQPNADMNTAAVNQPPVFKNPLSPPSTLDGRPLPMIGVPPAVSESFTNSKGVFFQGTAGGVVNSRNGQFSPEVGGGLFIPPNGGPPMVKP